MTKLRQWFCTGPDENEFIFTPAECSAEVALAIAKATYGMAIRSVKDEGVFTQMVGPEEQS